MTTDGKYISLAEFKQYGIGSTVDPGDPNVYNGNISGTPDDATLSQSIFRAEAMFEQASGASYDQQTYALTQAWTPFVDNKGFLHLFARERGPVTAVTAIQTRNLFYDTTWKAQTWTTDNLILPYSGTTHPSPEAWHVIVKTDNALPSASTGQLMARWSYTGGFATIPDSLKGIMCRLAWWIYKLRESPVAKVVNMPLGTMTVPLSMPPDIKADIDLWKPVWS